MEKKKKWIAVLAIFLLLCGAIGAGIQLYLSTKVKLIIPHDVRAEPMTWDWGELRLWEFKDTTNSTQKVTFTSYGAKPLTLSATVDLFSVAPTWFKPLYYSLDWTAEGHEIQPLGILETNFTLTVNVPLVRGYMIAKQINEADIVFDIIVEASDIPPTYYNLTIETTPNGTTDPTPGIHPYRAEIFAEVTAIPDSGYTLDCWNLDGVNHTVNPISILMDADHNVTAYFKEAIGTLVYVDPAKNSFAAGETFEIAVVVSEVTNLYALEILQFSWDPDLLEYSGHTVTIPVEDYPEGVLHKPTMPVRDVVDATAGTYWISHCSMGTAPTFNGTGIIFKMTFKVKAVGSCVLEIFGSELADSTMPPIHIEHTVINGYFDNINSYLNNS